MEWLSLKGDLTRQNAVEQLLAPSTSEDPDSELCVHTASVRRLDVVTAAAIRMRMARHHREHAEGTVTLVLPSQVELAARLFALLDPLPGRVTLTGQVDEQPPANYSLVPTTIVSDSHAAVALGGATLDACERARISRRRSIFVTEAAMELIAPAPVMMLWLISTVALETTTAPFWKSSIVELVSVKRLLGAALEA